jgi:transcriptional regulator with XRE-family HTH domain
MTVNITLRNKLSEVKYLRFNQGWTLRKIGEKFGVSRERVRQLLGNTGFYSHNLRKEFVLSNPQMTNSELREILNVSDSSLSLIRGRQHHATNTKGVLCEDWTSETLVSLGYVSEPQSARAPFDILVNHIARIDVKSSLHKFFPHGVKNPVRKFNVGVGNKRSDCDFYFCVMSDTLDYFIIPSASVPDTRQFISFAWPDFYCAKSNWRLYYQRWDLLDDFLAKKRV